MFKNKNTLKTDFYTWLIIILMLITIGTIFIYSSSSIFAIELYNSPHFFLKKQCIGIFLGLCGAFIFYIFPIQLFKKNSFLILLSALFLILLTLLGPFAFRIHGAKRWLNIFGFSFQPSEWLKIAIIIYSSAILSSQKLNQNKKLCALLFPTLVACLLLLKQPDFGSCITITSTLLMLLFISNTSLKLLITLGGITLPIISYLIYTKPYRWRRILIFLNPWKDPHGAGFQIIQSLTALGSGGLTGIGIAQSRQKYFYLPMQHTDFIVAIIGEETGFIGISTILILFILFLYYGIRISTQLTDYFAQLNMLGFVFLITLQIIINLAVISGLVPTKGIGLPFISYGNSSLICHLAYIGLLSHMIQNENAY